MFKKGPLSKVEIFYLQHNHNKIDISQLSVDMNRPIEVINKWIKKNIDEKPSVIRAGEHFARNKGATIMTENASTIADTKRVKNKVRQSCVTKIKNV
jgi:hypothetical protein